MFSLQGFEFPGAEELGQKAAETGTAATETVYNFAGNPAVLVGGIILIILAVLVIFFLKRIIVNSVLGLAAWLLLVLLFEIKLPLIPSLVASIVFGLAGIGVMLLMKFFGLL